MSMEARAVHVPNLENDDIPSDIAGGDYTVYKLDSPRTVRVADQMAYASQVVAALAQDQQRLLEFGNITNLLEGTRDERMCIHLMAKLVGTVPLLFVGFSCLLDDH